MAAAQYGLPLLVVVFNNKKYLSMRFNLTRAYPDGAYVTGRSGYGVDLSAQPDAAAVAAAAGAAGFTVTATPELAPDAGEGDRHGPGRPDRRRQRIPHPLTMQPAHVARFARAETLPMKMEAD